jgi:hypothetical protein
MQIQSSFRNQSMAKLAATTAPSASQAFQPALPTDVADIGNSVQDQDRFDGKLMGQMLGGMIGAGVGAAGGTLAVTLGSAALGLSGWGLAGAGVGAFIAGGVIGGYVGSR